MRRAVTTVTALSVMNSIKMMSGIRKASPDHVITSSGADAFNGLQLLNYSSPGPPHPSGAAPHPPSRGSPGRMGREAVRKGLGRAPAGTTRTPSGTRMPGCLETLGVEGMKPLGVGWGGVVVFNALRREMFLLVKAHRCPEGFL